MNRKLDKQSILERVRQLMDQHHQKMDSASNVSNEIKSRSEGYLEALYQVENVILNS